MDWPTNPSLPRLLAVAVLLDGGRAGCGCPDRWFGSVGGRFACRKADICPSSGLAALARPHARRDEVTLTSPVARDMTPAHAGTPATTGSAQIVSSAP